MSAVWGVTKAALIEERLTASIIRAYYDVYNALGFGFLENVYVLALERELIVRNHRVAREVSVPIMYKGQELCTQRLDMVVDDKVIIETKSTQELHPVALRQLYSYLRGSRFDVGLLLHFGRQPKFYRLVCSARQRSARVRVLEPIEVPLSRAVTTGRGPGRAPKTRTPSVPE